MTSKKLRILMVSDEWRPYIGGAGLCMELFAEELAGRGHELTIATAWHADAPAIETTRGLTIHRIRDLPSRARWISEDPNRHTPPPFVDPEAVIRLRSLAREVRPDLVPAYGWLAHSAAAALTGLDVPMVLWGHEYGNVCAMRTLYHLEREVCSGPAPVKCARCAVSGRGVAKGAVAVASVYGVRPLLRRRVNAIHGVSRFVTDVLDRELGSAGTSAVTIPNFHDESRIGAPRQDILDRLPEEPYILYVGALRKVKGIDDLLAAYGDLEGAPPLVMVGIRTPDTPAKFPPGVVVLNDVPHPTVMAMWDRALFGVFPSRWPEPLATVVHEAMSRGRPVIGTRPGGHEDMIDDGESGFLVGSGDVGSLRNSMRRLVVDRELRDRMGIIALERSRRFTREEVVPELERFYLEVAGREKTS
jgi:glycosyltransferase involved in cell wall biosynthesis